MVFFPKTFNPILVMTSDRPRLGDMLQDALPVFLKTTKVMKTRLGKCHRPEEVGRHGNETQCGSLEWLLEREEDNNEKPDEIQVKSGVYLTVLPPVCFSALTNTLWECKMLTLEKTVQGLYRNS